MVLVEAKLGEECWVALTHLLQRGMKRTLETDESRQASKPDRKINIGVKPTCSRICWQTTSCGVCNVPVWFGILCLGWGCS